MISSPLLDQNEKMMMMKKIMKAKELDNLIELSKNF